MKFRFICAATALFCLFSQPSIAAPKAHPVAKKAVPTKTTVPSKAGLTPAQKDAAQAALKSLRKLGAATSIGVTESDYRSRLIDTKGDVDEDLRSVPSGALKSNIVDAMQAYEDAATFWNEAETIRLIGKIMESDSGPILAKYNISKPQGQPLPANFDNETSDQMHTDLEAKIRITDAEVHRVLAEVWSVGSQKEQAADDGLK